MRTVVRPPASGIGHTAYIGVIGHLMTDQDAEAIAAQLADQGIPATITHGPGSRVNLRPTAPVTTRQEAQALRIVTSRTDAPVVWDGPPRQRVSPCLMCGATWVVLEHDLCAGCGLAFKPAGEVA